MYTLEDLAKGKSPKVIIAEEGPREGFQNASAVIPTDKKIEIINALLETGIKRINVASFVRPEVTPTMFDAEAVHAGINKKEDVEYRSLVLNPKGIKRAIAVRNAGGKIDLLKFALGFSIKMATLNMGGKHSDLTWDQFREYMYVGYKPMIDMAKSEGFRCNAGLSASFGSIYEGETPIETVFDIVSRLQDMGFDSVGFNDTTGEASPVQIYNVLSKYKEKFADFPVSIHFHNSRGAGLANILAALQVGLDPLNIDCCIGETGGDPPIPASKGNVATEDVVNMLEGMGIDTGIDLNKYLDVVKMAQKAHPDKFISHTQNVGPSVHTKFWKPEADA